MKEIIISGFWLMLSLYLSIESYRLGLSTGNRPGPGFFPFGAAVTIGAIAGFRLLKNARPTSAGSFSESAIGGDARLLRYLIARVLASVFFPVRLGFFLFT